MSIKELDEIIEEFNHADYQETLELLIDYSENLPELPEKFVEERDKGINRVHECETPVFLFVDVEGEKVNIFADVPPESPTVRGLVSILVTAFNGASPEEVRNAPDDLLMKIGIGQKIGMRRMHGLSAVYTRIKDEVRNKSHKH